MIGISRHRVATTLSITMLLGTPASIAAEPIGILEGTLDAASALGGPLSLVGERGFTFEGFVLNGVLGPAACRPCPAGTPISLDSLWLGLDVSGTATLEGISYPVGGAQPTQANAVLEFFGFAGLAPPVTAATATLNAPFGFQGLFTFPGLGTEQLFGFGTATVTLNRNPGDVWFFSRAIYQFSPVPEPATMVLVGTGLAAGALGARRRRKEGQIPTGR